MENQNKQLGFALRRVTTEQFATLADSVVEGKEVEIQASLRFGIDQEHRIIESLSKFEFEQENKTLLVLEVGCQFEIDQASWGIVWDEKTGAVTLPKGFASHLAMLTVGTTRGVLHAKTEKTAFNHLILPTINVASMIEEDVVLSKTEKESLE